MAEVQDGGLSRPCHSCGSGQSRRVWVSCKFVHGCVSKNGAPWTFCVKLLSVLKVCLLPGYMAWPHGVYACGDSMWKLGRGLYYEPAENDVAGSVIWCLMCCFVFQAGPAWVSGWCHACEAELFWSHRALGFVCFSELFAAPRYLLRLRVPSLCQAHLGCMLCETVLLFTEQNHLCMRSLQLHSNCEIRMCLFLPDCAINLTLWTLFVQERLFKNGLFKLSHHAMLQLHSSSSYMTL